MIYVESDIQFRFTADWVVFRYDTHRYYKGWSGAGLKGVDFIGILKDETLVLMEIKNYNLRLSGKRGHTLDAIQMDPSLLTEAFGHKIADTLTAIDAVRQYWQRHWWRRLALRWYSRRSPKSSEPAFWARVCALAENPEHCMAVLWLESNALDTAFRRRIGTQLSEELSALCARVEVSHSSEHPFADSLEVSGAPS